MFLKDLVRFSTQHRTLYCYMILSIWIFLLIAGMYKYIGHSSSSSSLSYTFDFLHGSSQLAFKEGPANDTNNLTKYKDRCMPLHRLGRIDDGGLLEGWKLQGVLLLVRHGDRGSLSHVRPLGHLDCGVKDDHLVDKYRSFLYNSTSSAGSNHMFWNKVGPFHGFALLPSSERECLLGQLTYKYLDIWNIQEISFYKYFRISSLHRGIAQLLHVGEILHQIYAHPLGLMLKSNPSNHNDRYGMDSTPRSQLLNSDEVVLYTTRVRRTFQSALALLYTFLPTDKWLALNIRESHSIAFCFNDCACPQADTLRKRLWKLQKQQLTQQPAVAGVMQWIGSTLLQHTPNGINDPIEVVDALLTVLCHDAPWPCRGHSNGNTTTNSPTRSTRSNDLDLSDVINIDQDDGGIDTVSNPMNVGSALSTVTSPTAEGCIESAHVAALLTYSDWQSHREAHHMYYKRIGLLRAYGLIRHMVSYMLRMISGDRTKFVLYSGHDWTLQYLTAALGIQTDNTVIAYASRLAIELYKSEAQTDYYFRVVYNGRDVTQQIDFCEGGQSLRVTRDSRGNKADLCPIENIIRFLHEDYFAPLNATNFKDACALSTKTNEF